MMQDQTTYSGAWYQGKQHGYGCVYNANNELKYGLYSHGQRLLKLNAESATDIQDGRLDLSTSKNLIIDLGRDEATFWTEIGVLSNKFEPFDNFATEQAKFELNKCTKEERAGRLL